MDKNPFYVYILYSETLTKYYVGSTGVNPLTRLEKHLTNHKGFTGRAKDWKIVKEITFDTKTEALRLEKKIKKQGIGRWLNNSLNQ